MDITYIREISIGGHAPLVAKIALKAVYVVLFRHMATFFRL